MRLQKALAPESLEPAEHDVVYPSTEKLLFSLISRLRE